MSILKLIKRNKESNLFISSIAILQNANILTDYAFLDCMVSNNTQNDISILKASISGRRGVECLCNMDPDIKFGSIQMAGDLPVMLKANETKRLVFEFKISDELRELLSRAELNEQDKLFVRVYTNRSVWKARIERCFGDMEDWFWQTKEILERRNGQPSG